MIASSLSIEPTIDEGVIAVLATAEVLSAELSTRFAGGDDLDYRAHRVLRQLVNRLPGVKLPAGRQAGASPAYTRHEFDLRAAVDALPDGFRLALLALPDGRWNAVLTEPVGGECRAFLGRSINCAAMRAVLAALALLILSEAE